MTNAFFKVPTPVNEPILDYAPGSPERDELQKTYAEMTAETIEIPLIIGGKEIKTGNLADCVMPHDHQKVIARYHQADASHVAQAIEAAAEAWKTWSEMPWQERAAVFIKAAELLAGPYRQILNASTMMSQGKTCFQAEIDAACELIDFLRFNVEYMTDIYKEQPMVSPAPTWNRSEHRALEGFVFAITPFNFTAICANLCASPAMMGNVVLWKPSDTAVYSGYHIMKLWHEAGLPAGVINFIPGPPQEIGAAALKHPDLAGIHFTGSTKTFQYLWKSVAENIENYKSYPRLVGETGGKDFVFAHESADVPSLAAALVRGAFEYSGQKCSAASRAYIPTNIWPEVKKRVGEMTAQITMGDVGDFSNFIGAVIDQRSFDKCAAFIAHAREAADAEIAFGGETAGDKGFFVQPTVIETTNPHYKSMCEEIFGPILTVYPYDPAKLDETLDLCDQTSPYALTGAIFGRDRGDLVMMADRLKHAAGNFYINDKPTGAVVGQQPFGGGRASGTNDKAGSKLNLLKWTSARSIKENFVPPTGFAYPHMLDS
ncbi:L-glutamate gamma-semialdehyde dehydrogenase [Acanthopleuribacter pedis]|uniref:L-glutamate gamma-semialdehyde dehydrogenase n=1 Tax=Acanthopleuribacter pedis TaxID=442870 RepID=A0A8J7Q1P3_9BACT|nr:L-glutamate gamma-semialdehyde dehydrogenase [Acanthopleuribacter pedis]MBO1316842.1 L-glutamate gamma-semialdehyde dehydrogenase [Acanthopleuribacter pedis]